MCTDSNDFIYRILKWLLFVNYVYLLWNVHKFYSSITESICFLVPSVTQIAGPASGSDFSEGAHTIRYRATDSIGQTAECYFTVTVTGKQLP